MLGIKLLAFLPLVVAVTSQAYNGYAPSSPWNQQYQPLPNYAPAVAAPPATTGQQPVYHQQYIPPTNHAAYVARAPAPSYIPPTNQAAYEAPAPAPTYIPPTNQAAYVPPAPAPSPAIASKQIELYNDNPTCHGPRSPICVQRNAYYSVELSCDAYVECRDYIAENQTCPDGMHFNMNAKWPEYPCGYPMDVPCASGRTPQPANPTADCPHQYGFFASPRATAQYCSPYRQCVAGKAIEMNCTMGLAFNPVSGRCEWPYLVSSCDADVFLGFKCPTTPLDAFGKPSDLVYNYKYEGNCYYFFSCKLGNARLLACDLGMAFDPAKGSCVNDELVECGNSKRVGEKDCDDKA